MAVFGFKGKAANCSKSEVFVLHARKFVQMLDSAVDMLGPNLDMLTDILSELGGKHVKYGVKPEYFPAMGIALVEALREVDKEFTKEIEISWREVYNAISLDMIRA